MMPKNLDYFNDHVHTTALGGRFMAVKYFELLSPIVDSLIILQMNKFD